MHARYTVLVHYCEAVNYHVVITDGDMQFACRLRLFMAVNPDPDPDKLVCICILLGLRIILTGYDIMYLRLSR